MLVVDIIKPKPSTAHERWVDWMEAWYTRCMFRHPSRRRIIVDTETKAQKQSLRNLGLYYDIERWEVHNG